MSENRALRRKFLFFTLRFPESINIFYRSAAQPQLVIKFWYDTGWLMSWYDRLMFWNAPAWLIVPIIQYYPTLPTVQVITQAKITGNINHRTHIQVESTDCCYISCVCVCVFVCVCVCVFVCVCVCVQGWKNSLLIFIPLARRHIAESNVKLLLQ